MRSPSHQEKRALLPDDGGDYYEAWLDADRLTHGTAAAEAFLRAHRSMFGQQLDVFARGYHTWLEARADTADAFAQYIRPRYDRWRFSLTRLDDNTAELLVALSRQREAHAA